MHTKAAGWTVFTVITALLAPAAALGQDSTSPGSTLTSDLQLAVGSAISKAAYQKAPIEAQLKQLQSEVNTLEAAVNSGKVIGTPELEENLKVSSGAIKAVKLKLSDPASSKVLADIIADVRLKNAASTETFDLFGSAKPTPFVSVRVNAKKNNQPQPGYSAILVPVGYGENTAWQNGKLASIPPGASVSEKFTPDALTRVLPGLYWSQVFKTKLLASRLVQIKLDTKEIDVELP